MVDKVVEVHREGFNKGIQNYSHILHLFTESTVRHPLGFEGLSFR